MDLKAVADILAGLVGFPALLAAIINAAKQFGWLADGNAPKANMIGNLLAFVAVAVAVLFGKVDLVPGIDVKLGAAANVLLAVLALLTQFGVTKFAHTALRGLPVIGFSHSENF